MSIQDIMNLSVPEKILLVEKLWDSIAEEANRKPLPEWKKKLLQERLAEHKKSPEAGLSWDELRKRYNA